MARFFPLPLSRLAPSPLLRCGHGVGAAAVRERGGAAEAVWLQPPSYSPPPYRRRLRGCLPSAASSLSSSRSLVLQETLTLGGCGTGSFRFLPTMASIPILGFALCFLLQCLPDGTDFGDVCLFMPVPGKLAGCYSSKVVLHIRVCARSCAHEEVNYELISTSQPHYIGSNKKTRQFDGPITCANRNQDAAD